VAKDAAATGDFKPVLEAMARLTQQCVACHSAYRLQ
jgi:cytochrome c556